MLQDTVQDKGQRNQKWQDINWKQVTHTVRQLQSRIVKAEKEGNSATVQRLRSLLLHSFCAKLLAVRRVVSNHGKRTPGVDGVVWNTPHAKMEAAKRLTRKGYRACPLRRVYIPKANGKLRALGIPGWNDKLLEEVIRLVVSAYFEPQFRESSHGFREGRGCHTALEWIRRKGRGTAWFIEGDIKGCFDNLDWNVLMRILKRKIKDKPFLKLIWDMLKAGYMEDWVYHKTYSSTPQGGIITPCTQKITLGIFPS